MFDLLCLFLIYRKGKFETRRKYNPKKRPAIPGQTHKIKIDRTKDVYGYIKILDVYAQKFGDINEYDVKNEGFESIDKYKEYFQKINGKHNDDDLIWVVRFKKLDCYSMKIQETIDKKIMELMKWKV